MEKCETCEIKDICKDAWCICGYCIYLLQDMQDDTCKCWECDDSSNCKFESRFKL